MKRIINHKVYDTDKAKQIYQWDNNLLPNDLNYCTETLCRKKTGEFFLYGESGANGKYSKSLGNNSWCGGEDIIPLDWEAAREWAESRMDANAYEEIFGEVQEDESRVVTRIKIQVDTLEKCKREAGKAGISTPEYINRVLTAAMADK